MVVFAALAITGCKSEESAEDSDRLILGVLVPMTGGLRACGETSLDGSIGTAPEALGDTGAARNFTGAYAYEFGERPPTPFINTACDATFVIALATREAGKANGAVIRNALRDVANPPGEIILPGEWEKAMKPIENGEDIDYRGASGWIDFDDNGDVGGTCAHWEIRGGKIETVKVFEPSC